MSYYFSDNRFVIEDYDQKKTFSSFLPGIAGVKGIPLWCFYANRGQGITSFGIQDKDEPIMEFFPANMSYQYVDRYGFRSFVKVDGTVFEPFSPASEDDVKRIMTIEKGSFSVEEINRTHQVRYKVTYFGLAGEPFAGLVRRVRMENIGKERTFEVVDGIANLLPSGASNEAFKNMSNLMVSWMAVENLENHLPFYKFRASSGDEAEVSVQSKGHFYLSFLEDQSLIRPIVDLALVFGHDTSLTKPLGFKKTGLDQMALDKQVLVNKVPSGFSPFSKVMKANEVASLTTIIGHTFDVSIINREAMRLAQAATMDAKQVLAGSVLEDLVGAVHTQTRLPLFDAYLKQNFLDNVLRGGYPLTFGSGDQKKVYHVFSRKHGDPERDYNFFTLAPEYYSQGNGNFRDVNQNRRCDVFFVKEAGRFNIKTFMNLIQLDGYNPLEVKGTTFSVTDEVAQALINQYGLENETEIKALLKGKFTPGKVALKTSDEAFLNHLISESTQHIEAVHGEGFWSDHFTYNFDLIETYVSVFPDDIHTLLEGDKSYRYYESPAVVLPREEKYGLTEKGEVRQYGSVKEKTHWKEARWVKGAGGAYYETHLAQKLLTLILTKYASLDPEGMGIEMEGNKPGWNDAMNGLPGMFGSGLSETVELVRVVRFLKEHLPGDIAVLEENHAFFRALEALFDTEKTAFELWDARSTIKETFREAISKGISGREVVLSRTSVIRFLERVLKVLMDGLDRAKAMNQGILPTYLTYTAVSYELLGKKTPYGLEAVRVKAFEVAIVPNFLEAPARFLKIGTKAENEKLHEAVRASDLYDAPLGTYKTSVSLEQMHYELGRIRAFTPGWLERESNFLHMTYKYLLGLIKGGLYDAFFEAIQSNLVCFMDPEVYGRSTLENSSFIASSLNPNPQVRGQGFVARLSGSTAEMLNIWQMMMFGKQLFTQKERLVFTPSPILTPEFFLNGRVVTTLFSKMAFVIENHTGYATFSDEVEVAYYLVDGERVPSIEGDLALKVRNGEVAQVTMVYQKK